MNQERMQCEACTYPAVYGPATCRQTWRREVQGFCDSSLQTHQKEPRQTVKRKVQDKQKLSSSEVCAKFPEISSAGHQTVGIKILKT
jgi:hypothetical protein